MTIILSMCEGKLGRGGRLSRLTLVKGHFPKGLKIIVLLCCSKISDKILKARPNGFQLPNNYFYRTVPNAVFNKVFASLFYVIVSNLLSYLCDKTRRKTFFLEIMGFQRDCALA